MVLVGSLEEKSIENKINKAKEYAGDIGKEFNDEDFDLFRSRVEELRKHIVDFGCGIGGCNDS